MALTFASCRRRNFSRSGTDVIDDWVLEPRYPEIINTIYYYICMAHIFFVMGIVNTVLYFRELKIDFK